MDIHAAAGGTVTPPTGYYAANTQKTFTAVPDHNFVFVQWIGTTKYDPQSANDFGEPKLHTHSRLSSQGHIPMISIPDDRYQSDQVSLGQFWSGSVALDFLRFGYKRLCFALG